MLTAQAEIFTAKVIVVMDGDTLMVLRDGRKTKIRLADIDAPEADQPFGKQSRESLRELVGKKQVRIDSRAVDRYGRIIGLVTVDGLDVNREQVRRGYAWAGARWQHKRTTRGPQDESVRGESPVRSNETSVDLQDEARQLKRGLWIQADPQSPSQWRKLHPSKPRVQLHDIR